MFRSQKNLLYLRKVEERYTNLVRISMKKEQILLKRLLYILFGHCDVTRQHSPFPFGLIILYSTVHLASISVWVFTYEDYSKYLNFKQYDNHYILNFFHLKLNYKNDIKKTSSTYIYHFQDTFIQDNVAIKKYYLEYDGVPASARAANC